MKKDQPLPKTITFEKTGKSYPVNADYRVMVGLSQLIYDTSDISIDDLNNILNEFYGGNRPEDDLAIAGLIEFFQNGSTHSEKENAKLPSKNLLSFEHDFGYIKSDFKRYYGVSLREVDFYHWWDFLEDLHSLPDDSMMMKVIGIRAVNITDIPKEQKRYYREQKEHYALPLPKHEQERKDKMQSDIELYNKRRAEKRKKKCGDCIGQ